MATDDKYDRQIRLWGGHGQKLLATSSVLLLNATGAATETLKNLILPAVGRFTIVDGHQVTERDCSNNFFVTRDSIGKSRAQVTCELLKELNPDVEGDFVSESVESYLSTRNHSELAKQFQLIIAADIDNTTLITLGTLCQQSGDQTGLISLRQYGLIGAIRVYKSELAVIESKPDANINDLRLVNPFPELKEYAMSIDFSTLESAEHKHIPYNVIIIQTLEAWKAAHGGQIPKTMAEKKQFKEAISAQTASTYQETNFGEAVENSYQCFSQMRDSVQEVLSDPKVKDASQKSHYWLLVAALERFFAKENQLPLSGKLPDMTSTTDWYITLQTIYQKKAHEDLELFTSLLHEVLAERGVFKEAITEADIRLFCSNAQTIEVTRMRSPELELTQPLYSDFGDLFYDDDAAGLAKWYIVTRAVETFREENHGRYPGHTTANIDGDFPKLRAIVDNIMKQVSESGEHQVEDTYVKEIIRYSDSKLHTISAFLGGVASQEAIKLLIKQYTPLNHTFIYDGIHGKCQVINV